MMWVTRVMWVQSGFAAFVCQCQRSSEQCLQLVVNATSPERTNVLLLLLLLCTSRIHAFCSLLSRTQRVSHEAACIHPYDTYIAKDTHELRLRRTVHVLGKPGEPSTLTSLTKPSHPPITTWTHPTGRYKQCPSWRREYVEARGQYVLLL